ncbi:ABC transporter permease [Flavitalea sp.]|nr:ABC transporter permease [Flavitalea sp.]
MSLLTSLRSEILKTKRTAAFYFTLVGAAVVPIVYLFNVVFDEINDTRKDPFNAMFKIDFEMNSLVFFPWFLILICTLMPQIEYKNNTWKQVFASPQTKATVFMAKFLSIHLLLLLFLTANHIFMFIAAFATHFILPELDLLNQPLNVRQLLVNNTNLYLTVLAIGTIQFWIGLRFRNFIVPIAIGLALWIAGTLMVFESHSVYAKYFPYSFQIFSSLPQIKPQLNEVEWTSLGYSVIVLILGFIDFNRRRISA